MKQECAFRKIVQGELPSDKLYEDDAVLAFTPKEQVSRGHLLVIPKDHYENIFDISNDCLTKIVHVVKNLSFKLKEELDATGINLLHASGKDAQQSVFHFHFHLVPRYPNDGLDLWIRSGIEK